MTPRSVATTPNWFLPAKIKLSPHQPISSQPKVAQLDVASAVKPLIVPFRPLLNFLKANGQMSSDSINSTVTRPRFRARQLWDVCQSYMGHIPTVHQTKLPYCLYIYPTWTRFRGRVYKCRRNLLNEIPRHWQWATEETGWVFSQ